MVIKKKSRTPCTKWLTAGRIVIARRWDKEDGVEDQIISQSDTNVICNRYINLYFINIRKSWIRRKFLWFQKYIEQATIFISWVLNSMECFYYL